LICFLLNLSWTPLCEREASVQVAGSDESVNENGSTAEGALGSSLHGPDPHYKAPLAAVLMALHEHVLSRPLGKLLILGCCIIGSMLSLSGIARVSIGLDQAVALPEDSYLQAYYRCGHPFSAVNSVRLSLQHVFEAAMGERFLQDVD
jgi:hypothetical protein